MYEKLARTQTVENFKLEIINVKCCFTIPLLSQTRAPYKPDQGTRKEHRQKMSFVAKSGST